MTSVDSLRSRVATIKARSNRDWIPRTWVFLCEAGERFPPDVQGKIDAEMRPNDRVYIREYPQGLLGEKEGNWTWGYVYWHGGASNILQDGTLEKVRKQ